jgi:hypothetical protein
VRLILLVAACATAPSHPAGDPVPLGTWCQQAGAAMCKSFADRCFNGLSAVAEGCNETFESSCLAGRPRDAATGRNYGELDQCVARIRSLSCEGLGAGIGSGALAQTCSVR